MNNDIEYISLAPDAAAYLAQSKAHISGAIDKLEKGLNAIDGLPSELVASEVQHLREPLEGLTEGFILDALNNARRRGQDEGQAVSAAVRSLFDDRQEL